MGISIHASAVNLNPERTMDAIHLAARNQLQIPEGSSVRDTQARCASRATWTRAGRKTYRVTTTERLVTCQKCRKHLSAGTDGFATELHTRLFGQESK